MTRRARLVLAGLVALLAALPVALAVAGTSEAKVYPYAYDQVWPATVRFLRVDEKLEISERDEAAGYVLFKIKDEGKSFDASLELSRVKDGDGREATRAAIKIDGRPGYVGDVLLARLGKKLRGELGEPAAPPDAPAK